MGTGGAPSTLQHGTELSAELAPTWGDAGKIQLSIFFIVGQQGGLGGVYQCPMRHE